MRKAGAKLQRKLVFPWLIILFLTAGSLPLVAENLIRNGGFEITGKEGLPVFWEREYNRNLSGPFFLSGDSYEGKYAACLMTEEWTLDRPQFLVQKVRLPRGVKRIYLSTWAKGQGLLRLSLQFLKGNEFLKVNTIKEYFGQYDVPEETDRVFNLGPEYTEYVLVAEVPETADGVRVRLGNTIGPLNLANVWGKVWLDQVTLAVKDFSTQLPVTDRDFLQKKGAISKKVRLPSGFVDIAPYLRISTDPPSFNPGALVDGVEDLAGLQFTWKFEFLGGTERYPRITFTFPELLPVSNVYLHLRGNVERFFLRGDTTGTGKYDWIMADVRGLLGVDEWVRLDLEEKNIRGLCIQAVEGNLRSYRSSLPFVDEVKIVLREEKVKPFRQLLQKNVFFRPKGYPPTGTPVIYLTRSSPPEGSPGKRFRKILTVDLWMFGINLKKDTGIVDYRKTENFQRVIQACRLCGFDSLMLFLEDWSRNLVPWPSKVASGTQENILKALTEAVHTEGLKIYVMVSSALSPPFSGKSLFLYPKEETSRYPQMEQFPSLVHGTYYRDKWLALLDEAMACGCDGVSLCPDENYYKGHFMASFPADDPGRSIYKQRFGHDLPEKEEDTLAFRQWILLRHEGSANLYGYWSNYLAGRYPGLYLGSRFMQPYLACSYITETGIPFDLLGSNGGIQELSSDYMGPYGIQMMAAANGWRKAGMCYDACMWGPLQGAARKTDIEILGEILWSVMYGLGMIDVYRENYLYEQGTLPAFARGFHLLKDLEDLGVWEARPAKKIALCSSRASLDWWQIKAWWGKHQEDWDRGIEGNRGWYAERVAYHILQRNGLPFDWFFLDNDRHLTHLQDYHLLVIPFAWSISQKAAASLKQAAKNGTRIILLDGKAGETDEWGEPYPEPVLHELLESKAAVILPEDVFQWAATDIFAEKVMKTLSQLLKEKIPLKFNAYGRHVDASLLEKNEREYFLFLINWEKAGTTAVDIGIPLPEGRYEIWVRDADFWYQGCLSGEKEFSSKDLTDFRYWMIPETVSVFYVRKKDKI